RVVQNPIDPKADPKVVLLRLDMDVGSAFLDSLGDDQVDNLHHRSVLPDLGQPPGGRAGLQRFFEGPDVTVDSGTQSVGLADGQVDFRLDAEDRLDALAGQHLELGEQ